MTARLFPRLLERDLKVPFPVLGVALALFQLAGCDLLVEAPDPAKVQAQVAEFREQEVDLVKSTISDPGRANRFLQLLAERDELISAATEVINAYREEMLLLNADYNASRESIEILVDRFNDQRAAAQREFVAVIGAMKAETTPDEWKVISKFQLKRLHPRRLTYGAVKQGG
jgi:hypothetical protein